MRFKRRLKLKTGQLDIAPLVDVVFLLLIFFMLTSKFIFQPGIRVNLPRAITSEVIQEKNLVLAITAENVIYLEGKSLSISELEKELKTGAAEGKSLIIKADQRSDVGRLVEVWDLCRDAGISRINVAADRKGK